MNGREYLTMEAAQNRITELEAANKKLVRALKVTANLYHQTLRANNIGSHKGSTFDQCNVGWCMEAIEAINEAK
jgi:hypothetical protein